MTKGFCTRTCVSWLCIVLLAALSVVEVKGAPNSCRRSRKQLAMLRLEYLRSASLEDWFVEFDKIRREAEQSVQEHTCANALLLKVMAGSASLQERRLAESLLSLMIERYRKASIRMQQLPMRSESEVLQSGFSAYFSAAAQLGVDCLNAQKTSDPVPTYQAIDGQTIGLLVERKRLLDELQKNCLIADGLTRVKFGLHPYESQ